MQVLKFIFFGYLALLISAWTTAFILDVAQGLKRYRTRRKSTYVILRNILKMLNHDAFAKAPCDNVMAEYGNLSWALCWMLPVDGVVSVADLVRGQEPSVEGGVIAFNALTERLDEMTNGWYFRLKSRGQQDLHHVRRAIDKIQEGKNLATGKAV